jgi:hypothetical protein
MGRAEPMGRSVGGVRGRDEIERGLLMAELVDTRS